MSTKHVFSDADGLVLKALRGAIALNPDLCLHAPSKSVYAKTRSNARVALVSGGGAGHEPAHAGYTGHGMLAGSISGDIFASPSATQVLTCIQLALAVQKTNHVLLIVNNYTGDRLNFGLAAEYANGLSSTVGFDSEKGVAEVKVETVVVADDVSLLDRPSLVGARGLAGNILVCKVLGAAAETGFSLERLKKLGDAVVANLASIGVGLSHCHVPGRISSSDSGLMQDGKCELGLGLHNEPGVRQMDVGSAQELVHEMLEQILSSPARKATAHGEVGSRKKFVQVNESQNEADEVVLYVNNLGGMSMLEMSAIVDEVVSQLAKQSIYPSRILLSSYMTSLNAPGFSLSLLNLSSVCQGYSSSETLKDITSVPELLSFIDAPTDATAWAGVRSDWPTQANANYRRSVEDESPRLLSMFSSKSVKHPPISHAAENARIEGWTTLGIKPEVVKSGIRGACTGVLTAENDLTQFDTVVGDGDCGETFSSGARAVLKALDEGSLSVGESTPSELMTALSELLLNSMGGTSGALFGLYLVALSNTLSLSTDAEKAPLGALHALSTHTPARPGDRTLVDALSPFCVALADGEGMECAVTRARDGAESTRGMRARLGRATYVTNSSTSESSGGEDIPKSDVPPDPGAWGVAALLEGLLLGLRAGKQE